MNIDMDSLINSFNYQALEWKPKQNFVKDINIITNEIISLDNFYNKDIYEILVSCGHDLTWDQEYYLSLEDLNWFKSEKGKTYFFGNINNKKSFDMNEYYIILSWYSKLTELFELQVEL